MSHRPLSFSPSLKAHNLKRKKNLKARKIWTVCNPLRCILTLDSSSSACSSPSLPLLGLPSASCTTCWQYDSQKNTYKILNYAWITCNVRCLNPLSACIQFYNSTTVLCGSSLSFLFQSERFFLKNLCLETNEFTNFCLLSNRVLLNCVVFFFLLQGFICGFSIATGAAARLLSGYDSYGNICGQKNVKVEGIVNSGLDLTHKK